MLRRETGLRQSYNNLSGVGHSEEKLLVKKGSFSTPLEVRNNDKFRQRTDGPLLK